MAGIDLYYSGEFLAESVQDGIVAFAGGGQGSASQITTQTARVTTVATAADSVKLPASTPGVEIVLINHGANSMQVFASSTDTIDDQASATGVSQMANSFVIYSCTSTGKWYSEGLSTGFAASAGLQTQSYTDSITAHAGGGQGSAVPLTTLINRVSTVGSAGDSVVLPLSKAGMVLTVINGAAANSMNLFPAVGDAINALGANAAFAMAAASISIFYCFTAGTWFTK